MIGYEKDFAEIRQHLIAIEFGIAAVVAIAAAPLIAAALAPILATLSALGSSIAGAIASIGVIQGEFVVVEAEIGGAIVLASTAQATGASALVLAGTAEATGASALALATLANGTAGGALVLAGTANVAAVGAAIVAAGAVTQMGRVDAKVNDLGAKLPPLEAKTSEAIQKVVEALRRVEPIEAKANRALDRSSEAIEDFNKLEPQLERIKEQVQQEFQEIEDVKQQLDIKYGQVRQELNVKFEQVKQELDIKYGDLPGKVTEVKTDVSSLGTRVNNLEARPPTETTKIVNNTIYQPIETHTVTQLQPINTTMYQPEVRTEVRTETKTEVRTEVRQELDIKYEPYPQPIYNTIYQPTVTELQPINTTIVQIQPEVITREIVKYKPIPQPIYYQTIQPLQTKEITIYQPTREVIIRENTGQISNLNDRVQTIESTCCSPANQTQTKPVELSPVLLRKFVRCNPETNEPEFIDYPGTVVRGTEITEQTKAFQLSGIEAQQCRELTAVAAVPELWPIKIEAGRPQLLYVYRELKSNGQIGTSWYTVAVPHPKIVVKKDVVILPNYTKGNHEETVFLIDNSRITIFAKDATECRRMIDAIKPLVKPDKFEATPRTRIGERTAATKFAVKNVKLTEIHYFAQGMHGEVKPDWKRKL